MTEAVAAAAAAAALTTAQLYREIEGLKESLGREIKCARELVEVRLNGMDRALELFHGDVDGVTGLVDEKIKALAGVHEEKFSSIQVQFLERDERSASGSRDGKVAVDAALQAAKEAVAEQNRSSALSIAKSEAATMKQLDQLILLITTSAKASDEKVEDLKTRITRIEGKDTGIGTAWGTLLGAVALIASLIAVGSFVWSGRQTTPAPGVFVPTPVSVVPAK